MAKMNMGALLVAPLLSGPAWASTVTTVGIAQATGGPPTVTSQSDTATNADIAVSSPDWNLAEQNADGTARVSASTQGIGDERTLARASFSQTVTNQTGVAQDYTLSFLLAAQTAEIFTPAIGLGFAPFNTLSLPFPASSFGSVYTSASFSYEILVDDSVVFDARADILVDPRHLTTLGPEIRFDLVDTFVPRAEEVQFGSEEWVSFQVDALKGDQFLGSYQSGQSFNVTARLTAQAYAAGGNRVTRFELPSLSNLGTITSREAIVTPTPVPLPAPAWLLLLGLGGLIAARPKS